MAEQASMPSSIMLYSEFTFRFVFFFNDTATTEIYTLSLHDALPISGRVPDRGSASCGWMATVAPRSEEHTSELQSHVNLVCRLLLEKKKSTQELPSYSAHQNHRQTDNKSLSGENAIRCSSPYYTPAATDARFFFFMDTAPTDIYTLSLHDALPS